MTIAAAHDVGKEVVLEILRDGRVVLNEPELAWMARAASWPTQGAERKLEQGKEEARFYATQRDWEPLAQEMRIRARVRPAGRSMQQRRRQRRCARISMSRER